MASDAAELQETFEARAAHYATFGNGTVARLAAQALPPDGRVLDIGCAAGGLLALLRESATFAAGIELSPSAAAQAAEVADAVHVGGVDDPDVPFEEGSFDLVVIADVIEHLLDPGRALARAVAWTRPGGRVIVSVPNIAHWQARLVVARGQWRADPSGTFDATHVRFFTVPRLLALAAESGLQQVELHPVVPRLANHVGLVERLPAAARSKIEERWQVLGRRRPNLLGYQLVVAGTRPATGAL